MGPAVLKTDLDPCSWLRPGSRSEMHKYFGALVPAPISSYSPFIQLPGNSR